MRLFVAVELSEDVRRAAAKAATVLRERLGPRVHARWVIADQLHITVRFIGQVTDDRVPDLVHAARKPLDLGAFDLRLGEFGAFPGSGPPRVIWVGVEEGLRSLARIHEEMNRRLEPFGFEAEKRPFSAHLTLARIKDLPRRTSAHARHVVKECPPLGAACVITQATVFRSHLSPAGSRYESLAHVPLAG
jgi:RNA 2',3'-cyclic 3'-phosphodiesterase